MNNRITQAHIDDYEIATGERPAPRPPQPMKRLEAVALGLALLGLLVVALYKF